MCVVARVLFAVVALFAGATDARALEGNTLAADDPLGAARAAVAGARFDEAKAKLAAAGVAAPGLLGATLVGLGDEDGACAIYERDRTSARAPAAALRAARCLDKRGDVPGALASWIEVSAGPFAADALVIDELAAFIEARDLPGAGLGGAFDVEVALFDDARREALGRALLVAVRRGDPATSARALDKLLVQLSDSEAARVASSLPQARARPKEDLAHALARASALEKRHESAAVIAALSPFNLAAVAGDVGANAAKGARAPLVMGPLQCEAQLLLGKSQRKLRKYAAAKKHLDAVASSCPDDVKKRGAYLAARVAWLSKNATAKTLLRAFADAWPEDTLTDDVLLWLGDAHERSGDTAKAEAAWHAIVEGHPGGDMIHEARFRLAWSRARAGDSDGARAILDDAARGAGAAPSGALVAVADRAWYWRARLAFAPRLDTLEPTADARARAQALAALAAFANSRPASWYGHLARLLVQSDQSDQSATAIEVAARVREHAASASVTMSPLLAKDSRFALARTLIEGGYDAEALILLAALPMPAAAEDRFAVALLIDRAGARGGAHGFLRNAGLALLPGTPSPESALAWALDWPRAFAPAIVSAAQESQLPPSLLFALAREESAFDADVVSWAGAVGLCQLMPPTAADEAKAKKLAVPDVDALRDPVLNASLGAAHLARRLKLGHPALAIAAYNAGPGAVAVWSPHGPLDAWVEQIPVDETRNYVKKVTGSWVTYSILDGAVDDVAFSLVLR